MTRSPHPTRSRARLVILLAATIAGGLASRAFPEWLPPLIARYAGDTLWAVAAYWCFAFVVPSARTTRLGAAALGLAFAVEASQLYRAPWIDTVRRTWPGALLLGQGFLWSDLLCYLAGAVLAMLLDRAAAGAGRPPSPKA